MIIRRAALAIAVATLGFLGTAEASGQVSIGLGVHVNIPPLPPHRNVFVARPSPHAVWIEGYWARNSYTGQHVWIAGHWTIRHPQPVYREHRLRHIPQGVAKGWWKKHRYDYGD